MLHEYYSKLKAWRINIQFKILQKIGKSQYHRCHHLFKVLESLFFKN